MPVSRGYGHQQVETVIPVGGVQCPAQEGGVRCSAILPPVNIWRVGETRYLRALEILPRCQSSCIITCPNPNGLRPHDVVIYTAYNPEDPSRHEKIQLQAAAEFPS